MVAALEITSTTPAEAVVRGVELSDEARALVPGSRNARGLIDLLLEKGLARDAARVMLRAMPRRYAVAWLCDCIRRDVERQALTPFETTCLEAAENWIRSDTEESRRAAADRAKVSEYRTPSAMAAAAAAWSGGSLSAPGFTVVPPPDHLTAEACFGGVLMLAVREPLRSGERLEGWVRRALASFGPAPAPRAS
jgi:hypothetical protein